MNREVERLLPLEQQLKKKRQQEEEQIQAELQLIAAAQENFDENLLPNVTFKAQDQQEGKTLEELQSHQSKKAKGPTKGKQIAPLAASLNDTLANSNNQR